MIADPRTRKFCENGDTFQGWIGPDVHFLFSTIKNGSDCCWVMTHKDEADIDESWSLPGKMEDVYKVIEGWDPMCKAIVEKTPSCGEYANAGYASRTDQKQWTGSLCIVTLFRDGFRTRDASLC